MAAALGEKTEHWKICSFLLATDNTAQSTWPDLVPHRIVNSDMPNTAGHYQICTNCVMDTSDPGIRFDEQGRCDHCINFYQNTLAKWHPDDKGRAILEKKVARIKERGRSRDYDCIIGVSGGADSSYLVYLAKEKLGLRPLVFHVDGGWNSQIAVNNIEKIIDGLGLELYTEVINWREMRDLQLAFFRSGVPNIDIPQDHAFFATMYNFANKYNVKYILTGSNIATECVRNPLDFFYYGTDLWQIRDIHRRFGEKPLIDFPLSGILRHKVYLRYLRGVEVVQPLDFMPYVKNEAMKLLADKFGWQIYPRKHFESRFTKFFEGYWLPKKFGFDTRRVQYSSLILTKQMTRGDALAELEKPPYDEETIAQDFEYIATKLEISVDQLKGYLDAPKKSHKDYRNQEGLFQLGAWVLHSLGVERRARKR
jgi:N-acetyl sugar amidotransferase